MRKPVSGKKNIWFNGQAVDDDNLTLEQNYNDLIQTSLINNHIGTGILPENLIQNVLFDSNLASGLLDGKAIDVQKQPADNNFGNQLEIEIMNSSVAGKRAIKLLIIGLDFQGNLQYDRFVFSKNEKQYSGKHYTKILKILFNDFIGDTSVSLNLGGRVLIKETKSFNLSRDCIMVAQDLQPNIFFRDLFVNSGTIDAVLTSALPSYNIDALNITSGYLQLRGLVENDVSSQIGQKFQATTNNIQKITLLLAVSNSINPTDLEWTGDLIVSLFQLQSVLDCPLDIAPGTAIDFDPSNIPLAQLSLNYDALFDRGIVLNETPQPIDFIFSNTPVGSGAIIKSGGYYAITIKRAGSADKCVIQAATGTDKLENSKITFFNGAIWVDNSDEDLWFQVWTDSAKVSDGQAYENGHGIVIPKTKENSSTGITEDYLLDNIQFVRNDVYYGITDATTEESELVQDQRTGERVLSQQQFVPTVSLITANELVSREVAADPLIIGTIADKNLKIIGAGSSSVSSKFHHFGIIKNQCVIKVIDDPSDSRYDLTVINLITELTGSGGVSNINGLLNSKFIIDPVASYRVVDTEIVSMIYGDLNGDGIVDSADIAAMQPLIGIDLNDIPSREDYISYISLFANDNSLSWQLLDDDLVTVLDSGADGSLVADPTDGSSAVFTTPSTDFSAVSSLSTKRLRIFNNTNNPGNNGKHHIVGLINSTNIVIQKTYLTSDKILELLRADINGDMIIDASDSALMLNYVNKVSPFPAISAPANKIGTEFKAIRLTCEKYIDRNDDYFASGDRSNTLHTLPDLLIDGYLAGFSLFGTDLEASPSSTLFTKQLGWNDYLVVSTSNPKLVLASFNYQSGSVLKECSLEGIIDDKYPLPPAFDPGRNDLFVPNHLVLNDGGEILRPDGYFAKMDFEVGSVVLEIPAISFTTEKTINIFSDFVADFTGDGRTRLGYNAMRFADCSTVGLTALADEQIRFAVSVRSFSPQINGVDGYDISGIIVDGKIGVSLDPETGILTLNFANLYEDPVLQTLKTRVQITVFLKKAGFNNSSLIVDSTRVKNLLGL